MIGDTCGVEELVYNFCGSTEAPDCAPTAQPTVSPTESPSAPPSASPSLSPSVSPSLSSTDPQGLTCDVYPEARYVRISQNVTTEQLAMFEVLVFSNGTNVAFEKPSNQSSTLIEGSIPRFAYYAVDGDYLAYSHTDCDDPWWIVDLGCMMPIELVTIMNRWCDDPSDPAGCLCMLSNATLELLDTNMTVVQTKEIGDTCGVEELSFNFCVDATESPDRAPTASPTASPTELVTAAPSASSSGVSTEVSTVSPSKKPTAPSSSPTISPTEPFNPDTLPPTDAAQITTQAPTSAFDPSPPAPTPIVISIPSSMTLDNFVVPATQDEYDAVVGILEVTLQQSIESLLSDGQSLSNVSVTSIGGQTGSRRRFLESTEVEYTIVLEDSCGTNCDNAASGLYDSVTSQLASHVDSGAFASDLQSNALANGNAASLVNASVQTPVFDAYHVQNETPDASTETTVTTPPTLRPSNPPVSHNSQTLPAAHPKPTSSGGRLSSHVIYTIVGALVLLLII
jgi:hypothetical protein